MLTPDYSERVYAGVLGKIIGVYLGRPFEGWTNNLIEERLGDIDYYVHDKVGVPLIVTDDDISGTFTFIRSLEDNGFDPQLSPKQIGNTWLNYLIENRSVLWWGGLGNSTEHTAYIRLSNGIDAPASGSMEVNGQVVAEQIGAQIFIDGWAMVCPGDPEMAADLARRAASVSHDGEAVYGAQVLAAMEAQAFVEDDIDKLLDVGVAQIPTDSILAQMIRDIRQWHSDNPQDWRQTFKKIQENYGYDKYGGNCHIMPNHGLIIMALLHSDGDFSKALMIVNTAGWDTDCNSGNLGCLMGIRNGIEGIEAGPDWRTPFSDICYLPTADSGGGVSDAAAQADRIALAGARLNGESLDKPKNGARYHFSYPGSVQGFRGKNCEVSNQTSDQTRSLSIVVEPSDSGESSLATTGTFIDSLETAKYFEGRGYGLMTSPKLNSGQTVSATVGLDSSANSSVDIGLCVHVFDKEDKPQLLSGPTTTFEPSQVSNIEWQIPSTDGYPIADVGIEIRNAEAGTKVWLDRLDWHGTPEITLQRCEGTMWRRAWVNAVDSYVGWRESFRLIQNSGTGLLLHGTRDWNDYRVDVDVTPHLVTRSGVAARVQGLRRYYALVLNTSNQIQLVKEYDGTSVLAEQAHPLNLGQTYELGIEVKSSTITGFVDGREVLSAEDHSLSEGGIGLLITEGRSATQMVSVKPVA